MGSLDGKVALVAGATRGAGRGIAVELGAAGAQVFVTGRSTAGRRSDYDRPETIEETAELVTAAGGTATAVVVDHLDHGAVRALVERIDRDAGRLDVLVNDIWGGELLVEWGAPIWEHDLDKGLRLLRLAVDTHLVTSHFALPLLIRRPGGLVVEMTDGTAEYNGATYRLSAYYDLAKWSVIRLAWSQGHELAAHGCTAVALTPGWLRSEMMLDIYGVTRTPGATCSTGRTSRPSSTPGTSGSPRRRASSAVPWPPSPRTPTCAAGTSAPPLRGRSPPSTASPTSTAAHPTRGATSSRCRTPEGHPTRRATAEDTSGAAPATRGAPMWRESSVD